MDHGPERERLERAFGAVQRGVFAGVGQEASGSIAAKKPELVQGGFLLQPGIEAFAGGAALAEEEPQLVQGWFLLQPGLKAMRADFPCT
mmetsp:Transcript_99608/g.253188  ORF Transcript_99608/g.253188 Transcript_99608/m.253188 type:complete len:89 (+) Transcript_99608:1482-1748(+)